MDAAMAVLLLEQFYFRIEGDPVGETPALLQCLVKEVGMIHKAAVGAAVAWFFEREHTRDIEIQIEAALEEMGEISFEEEREGWGN
jgi:hypothetical protein